MDIAMLKDQIKIKSNMDRIKVPDNIEATELIYAFEVLCINSTVKVSDLARYLKYSERTLRRKSQQHFNISPTELLKKIRLNKATLLLKTGIKCSQIWHQVGFSSHSYFSDMFKVQYGVMPSEFALC
jgi:AraC-like DNA-binding protein